MAAEKKINGREFRVPDLLATEALTLQARLFKILGPAVNNFGAVFAGHGSKDDETLSDEEKAKIQAASGAAALQALSSIFMNLQPNEYTSFVNDVMKTVQIKRPSGQYDPCDLDGDFTMHKKDIVPVVLFALREHFGDFFADLPGVGNLGVKAQV